MLSTIEYQNFTDTASSQFHKERPEESANPPLIIIRITFGLKRVQTAGQLSSRTVFRNLFYRKRSRIKKSSRVLRHDRE